jgi:hypothetical protein
MVGYSTRHLAISSVAKNNVDFVWDICEFLLLGLHEKEFVVWVGGDRIAVLRTVDTIEHWLR